MQNEKDQLGHLEASLKKERARQAAARKRAEEAERLKADELSLDQFKEIIDIKKATEGVLEPVTPPAERKAKAQAQAQTQSGWVRSEVKKDKDLADFS